MKKLISAAACLVLLISGISAGAESSNRHPKLLPVYLQPQVGEYFYLLDQPAGEELFRYSPDAALYGFIQDHAGICSAWCAVTTHTESVRASSYLEPQGKFTYEPGHLIDGDRNTVWAEGVPGCGIGEYIVLTKCYNEHSDNVSQRFTFENLCIVNGYAQNEQKWRNNSRVKSLELYVNDNYLYNLYLEDTIQPQYFDLTELNISAAAGEKIRFGFRIAEVYPGDKYDDTCITGIEIEFWTPNH